MIRVRVRARIRVRVRVRAVYLGILLALLEYPVGAWVAEEGHLGGRGVVMVVVQ